MAQRMIACARCGRVRYESRGYWVRAHGVSFWRCHAETTCKNAARKNKETVVSDKRYTPNTLAVREIYVENAYIYDHIDGEDTLAPYRDQFDRWISGRDAQVAKAALDGLVIYAEKMEDGSELDSQMVMWRQIAVAARNYQRAVHPETEG